MMEAKLNNIEAVDKIIYRNKKRIKIENIIIDSEIKSNFILEFANDFTEEVLREIKKSELKQVSINSNEFIIENPYIDFGIGLNKMTVSIKHNELNKDVPFSCVIVYSHSD